MIRIPRIRWLPLREYQLFPTKFFNGETPHPPNGEHARHHERQHAEFSSQRFEVASHDHVALSETGSATAFGFHGGLLSSNHAESRVSGMIANQYGISI